LTFAIYDFDRFSRHDQIGEVLIPLGQVDLGKVIQEFRDITPPAGEKENVKIRNKSKNILLFAYF
jgi:synaptotagmin-1